MLLLHVSALINYSCECCCLSQCCQYTAAAQAHFVWNGKLQDIAQFFTSGQHHVLREVIVNTAGLLQCLPEPAADVPCCGAASSLLSKHCPGTALLALTSAMLTPGLDHLHTAHSCFVPSTACNWVRPVLFQAAASTYFWISWCNSVTLLTKHGSLKQSAMHLECL